MTPDNEIVIEPQAERVGRELSRWFGSSDFSARTADTAAVRKGIGKRY